MAAKAESAESTEDDVKSKNSSFEIDFLCCKQYYTVIFNSSRLIIQF